MRQRFQQVLVLLFSGLVALSSQLFAGQLSQPATDFYGVSVSNFGVTLLKQGPDSKPLIVEKTTLNSPELFGDPPNIFGNDSPIIFITLFLTDEEAAALRKANEVSVEKYGEQLRRQLYISAAGYKAAVKQNLGDLLPNTEVTVEKNIRNNLGKSHLNKHFRCTTSDEKTNKDPLAGLSPREPCIKGFSIVEELDQFGCFNEPNKAEFNICATRWAFEFRTGIKFERHMIVMEQDNAAMAAMANHVVQYKKLPRGRHFILQATTLAQPYFNSPEGLIGTPGWMGLFAKTGGYRQIGTDYGEFLKKDFDASESDDLKKFMANPESGLHHTVERYFNESIARGDIYIAGNRVHDEAALLNRIKILFARNNIGDLMLRIADTSEHASLAEFTGLSAEHLQQSLTAANVFLSKARQYGAFSLALFLGLLEPALEKNSYIIVVGEQAEWFANSEGKDIPTVLRDIANDQARFEELHAMYLKMKNKDLSNTVFDDFQEISGGSRSGHNVLYSGMGKEYVKDWLIAMADKVSNVHFVPRNEYNDALLMSFRTRYTSARRAITAQ